MLTSTVDKKSSSKIMTPDEVAAFCQKSTSCVYDHWEELEAEIQEAIVDLIASIIENKKPNKPEEPTDLIIHEEANATPMPIGRWLTMKEAMTYAKVKSVNPIKKWIVEGYIYAHKRTGSWIIDRQSIDDWYLADE